MSGSIDLNDPELEEIAKLALMIDGIVDNPSLFDVKSIAKDVKKYKDIESDKEIIVKSLSVETFQSDDMISKEFQLLKAACPHPNVVNCYDCKRNNPQELLIFMEFMAGGSLGNFVAENGPLSEDKIINFSIQILEGLNHLHSKKILHRDLKPNNILLDESQEQIKLADFDCAMHYGRTSLQSKNSTVMGTSRYMAPEVIKANPENHYGPRADMWSLGCCMLEMITGKPPMSNYGDHQALFRIGTTECLEFELPSTISVKLQNFVAKLLASSPEDRPYAAEALNNLRKLVAPKPAKDNKPIWFSKLNGFIENYLKNYNPDCIVESVKIVNADNIIFNIRKYCKHRNHEDIQYVVRRDWMAFYQRSQGDCKCPDCESEAVKVPLDPRLFE